jgi:hypothetical protein
MTSTFGLDDVLDAAEKLSADEQAELIAILNRRLAEAGRRRVADEVRQARAEFAAGQCRPATAADLLREAAE